MITMAHPALPDEPGERSFPRPHADLARDGIGGLAAAEKRGGWSDRRSRDASAETGTRAEHTRMDNGHLAGYEMDSFHATRAERWRTCGVPG